MILIQRAPVFDFSLSNCCYSLSTDTNECNTNNGGCSPLRPCQNTVGSFSCADCPTGYVNNGSTTCDGMTTNFFY